MKPKENYLNYALLSSANCEPNKSPLKEDIPIDLSTKRPTHGGHPYALFKEYEHIPYPSPPHLSEWPMTTKYCLPPWLAKQYHAYPPPSILPYLFINPNCLTNNEIERKHEEPLYEQLGLPYRLPPEGILFPYKYDPYGPPLYRIPERQYEPHRKPLGSESSSSSASSSPYEQTEWHHYQQNNLGRSQASYPPHPNPQQHSKMLHSSPPSSHHFTAPVPTGHQSKIKSILPWISHSANLFSTKGSHSMPSRAKLKKSQSYSNLTSISNMISVNQTSRANLRRAKSEQSLHFIKSYPSAVKICAPKKVFVSNYYQMMKENDKKSEKEYSHQHNAPNRANSNGNSTRFYRNYRKEVIECWDNENKDNGQDQENHHQKLTSSSDNALDLRTNTLLHKLPDDGLTENIKTDGHSTVTTDSSTTTTGLYSKLSDVKHSVALPLDIYRQYYYYLIQEPAFASRAAAAMADTYAKLLSNKMEDTNAHHHQQQQQQQQLTKSAASSPVDKLTASNSSSSPPYESSKRTSPDFILNGSRTELRSADTTNCNLSFDRKRISRPLTGKHVRHGTGASPSTLVSLRNMIQQRQKLREIGKFDSSSRYCKTKGNKRIKRK